MDIVITLCGNAEESCPWTPPEIRRIHWPIADPVGTIGSEEKIMNEFRRARDEIKAKTLILTKTLDRTEKLKLKGKYNGKGDHQKTFLY